MKNVNKVIISGNITREPELRQTANGTSVLTFGIACNDSVKNSQTGQYEDYANFIDCTLFGARADSLSNILYKGCKVCIDGRLHFSQWQAQDGSTRSKLDVIVDNLDICSKKQDAPQQVAPAQPVANTNGVVTNATNVGTPPQPTVQDQIPF